MKEITREVTKTETMYYEAVDGAHFNSKEDCLAYENSAKCVVMKEIEKYRIAKTNEQFLFDDIGSDEYLIEIYNIANEDVLRKLNIYRNLCDSHTPNIGEEFIGKTILLAWDYDQFSSWNLGTLEDIFDRMRKRYLKAITPEKEEINKKVD